MDRCAELVEAFADGARRNAAIVELVGAINARDLRRVALRPEARTALIAGLDHPNAKVRWWCLQLLDHLADASLLAPIAAKLADPVAKVRRHAAHAIGCAVCKPDREPLAADDALAAATDPDATVRAEASEALARLAGAGPR